MTTEIVADEDKVSRRSFLAALFAGAVAATFVAAPPSSEAEAAERQFTRFRHEPRHRRPRSPLRGWRRHRRIARIHHHGAPRPHGPETPYGGETPAQ